MAIPGIATRATLSCSVHPAAAAAATIAAAASAAASATVRACTTAAVAAAAAAAAHVAAISAVRVASLASPPQPTTDLCAVAMSTRSLVGLPRDVAAASARNLLVLTPADSELAPSSGSAQCPAGVLVRDWYSCRAATPIRPLSTPPTSPTVAATTNINSSINAINANIQTEDIDTTDNDDQAWVLFSREWAPADGTPVASVLALHGSGEHVLRYNHVFTAWARRGVRVVAFDQRGFGRSGCCELNADLGGPGASCSFAATLRDVDSFVHGTRIAVNYTEPPNAGFPPSAFLTPVTGPANLLPPIYVPGIPFFVFGHSMGGALALVYARTRLDALPDSLIPDEYRSCYRGAAPLAGILCSAPCLRLAPEKDPGLLLRTITRCAARLFPKVVFDPGMDAASLSNNMINNLFNRSDVLNHSRGSFEYFHSLVSQGQWLVDEARDLGHATAVAAATATANSTSLGTAADNVAASNGLAAVADVPTLIVVGTNDKLCDHNVSIDFVRHIRSYAQLQLNKPLEVHEKLSSAPKLRVRTDVTPSLRSSPSVRTLVASAVTTSPAKRSAVPDSAYISSTDPKPTTITPTAISTTSAVTTTTAPTTGFLRPIMATTVTAVASGLLSHGINDHQQLSTTTTSTDDDESHFSFTSTADGRSSIDTSVIEGNSPRVSPLSLPMVTDATDFNDPTPDIKWKLVVLENLGHEILNEAKPIRDNVSRMYLNFIFSQL